jgi:Tfp pilus assembly protein PilX
MQIKERSGPTDERGFALVLALAMIAILSLLGVLVLNTADTELSISGNYRNSQQAFFAAERAVEYAMGNTAIVGSTASSVDLNDHAADIHVDGSGLDTTATNVVENLGVGELPDWLATRYGREKFGGNFYSISVTGEGRNGRSRARIEAEQVRIFQKDDEGQLITTSGG